LLGKKSHPDPLSNTDFPQVRLEFAGQDFQQGGLSNAIVSHEGELFPLGYSQRNVFKKPAVIKCFCDQLSG
jgi:hypothetical protein